MSLYPADENEAIEVVQERLPDADKSDVINAVIKCDGNIGKSIEFLTNGSGTEEQLIAEQIAQSILLPKNLNFSNVQLSFHQIEPLQTEFYPSYMKFLQRL